MEGGKKGRRGSAGISSDRKVLFRGKKQNHLSYKLFFFFFFITIGTKSEDSRKNLIYNSNNDNNDHKIEL